MLSAGARNAQGGSVHTSLVTFLARCTLSGESPDRPQKLATRPLSKVAANSVAAGTCCCPKLHFRMTKKVRRITSQTRPAEWWIFRRVLGQLWVGQMREACNLPISRRHIDAFPELGTLALHQLSNAEAQLYLLTTRTGRVERVHWTSICWSHVTGF